MFYFSLDILKYAYMAGTMAHIRVCYQGVIVAMAHKVLDYGG